jgi:acyl-CoA reductase-like NAD-dependent aldehyde dehydrogenase
MDTRHVDQALTVLDTRKTQWARLPIRDKIGCLRQIQQLALTHAQRWADAELKF